MTQQYRHGDVYLVATNSLPAGATELPRGRGDVILAYGEVTGHAHRIHERTAVLWDADGQRYLTVDEGGAALTHEEHARIDLPAGCYRVVIQREYAPDAIRNVAD